MRTRRVLITISLLVVLLPGCSSATKEPAQSSEQSANRTQVDNPKPDVESTGIIKAAHTAKDDGKGAPGEKSDTFGPADRTIHCVVELAEAKSGNKIRFSWMIVDAEGASNEKINDLEYTTRPEDSTVHGHLSVPEDWPPGKYKVEVYVNGNLEKTVEYSVI